LITATMNIYAHVLDDAKDALAARMDASWGQLLSERAGGSWYPL